MDSVLIVLWFLTGVIAGALAAYLFVSNRAYNAGLNFADKHWMAEFRRLLPAAKQPSPFSPFPSAARLRRIRERQERDARTLVSASPSAEDE